MFSQLVRKIQKEKLLVPFFSTFDSCMVSDSRFLMENFIFIYVLLVQWGCDVVGMNLRHF